MPRRGNILCLAGVLIGTALVGVAHAQWRDDGDSPIAPFAITEREGAFGFETEYREEEQRRDGSKVGYENTLFQEYIRYRLEGYAYHPRLLDFDAEAKIGLAQFESDTHGTSVGGGTSASDDATLENYGLRLYILKKHPISAFVFLSREERPILGSFANFYLVETETQRFGLTWKYINFPMSLWYTNRHTKQRGSISDTDIQSELVEYTLQHFYGAASRTEFRYLNQRFEQEVTNDDEDRVPSYKSRLYSDEFSVLNTTYFSLDKRRNLTSLIRYYDQKEDQEIETTFWREDFRWQHTPNFRTFAQASANKNEFAAREVDAYNGEIGFSHLLYESLESQFDLHGRQTEFDEITEQRYGGTASFRYRKSTPWGELSGNYDRTIDQFERQGERRTIPVVNEASTLRINGTTFLRNLNVVPESIRVTNLARDRSFVQGFDYIVVVSGDRVGLQALPGGQIANNSSVSVDYRYEVTSDFTYISDDQELYLRHDFLDVLDGLAVYGSWRELEPRDLSDDREVLEYEDRMAGFELEWDPLRLREEYEEYESNFNQWAQWRNQIEGSHTLTSKLKMTWNAGLDFTNYDEEQGGTGEDATTARYATVRFDGQFGRSGFWGMQGRAEQEEGIVEQTIYGLVATLGWDWRKTSVEIGAHYDVHEYEETDREKTRLFIQIERKW